MRRLLLLLTFAALSGCASTPSAAQATATPAPASTAAPDEAKRFRAILEEEWEWGLRESPVSATFLGDERYDHLLGDSSLEAFERRKQHARELLEKLKALDARKLPEEEQLNYALFRRDAEESVESQRFPDELMPISQLGGPHTLLAMLAQVKPPRSVKDVDNFVSRLRAYPKMVDDTIFRLKTGLERGITPPQVTLKGVEATMRAQVPADPAQSPIVQAYFRAKPTDFTDAQWTAEREKVLAALREAVYPAYEKLLGFWTGTYFPKARQTLGLSELPDGKAWYAFNARHFTTTALSPAEIHEIGLAEVKRIRAEMEATREKAGFKGALAQFFHFLRTDPKFFFETQEDLLVAYRDLAKRIDPRLPELFGKLPRLPYGIEPVPAFAEKTAPAAYYRPGSIEAGRAGNFFANTYDLTARPRWEMEALAAHEAVPGHHLQISLAQELGELPNFRRHGGYTAYVEGWGLYAESLGEEIGLYQDPYSKMGQLSLEMWRAIRLVVDTGLHSKGWSREQAVQFFLDNAPKPRLDAEIEVDRYIVMPGQALGYKIGELEIQKLRVRARSALGENFDLRAFHDAVLGAGALPLEILSARIEAWISSQSR